MNKRSFLKSLLVIPFSGKPILSLLKNLNKNKPYITYPQVLAVGKKMNSQIIQLKCQWTLELANDLKAFHNINCSKELLSLEKYEQQQNSKYSNLI